MVIKDTPSSNSVKNPEVQTVNRTSGIVLAIFRVRVIIPLPNQHSIFFPASLSPKSKKLINLIAHQVLPLLLR